MNNTVYLDRNCSTCMTGNTAQILSYIKMACLSYVNSPIYYGLSTSSLEKNSI
jgi:hypothetical protein